MESSQKVLRVLADTAALELIARLEQSYGKLMFHQSGGCCDGSQPMCFPLGEFIVGSSDVLLGYVGTSPFYMSKDQFEYWKHTQLTLSVVEGRGSSFSIEIPLGYRFIIKSRLFSDEELASLEKDDRP
ncbi:MAG: DUF779 domain-containing protein [Bacteroidetes bacterium]|nr:MAG: DUF779 domain-containing protein [Bacteroidota bacterium]